MKERLIGLGLRYELNRDIKLGRLSRTEPVTEREEERYPGPPGNCLSMEWKDSRIIPFGIK
jgi:hypothetical protein